MNGYIPDKGCCGALVVGASGVEGGVVGMVPSGKSSGGGEVSAV
jgi:hypothetical protein